jgi:hypothetical protein
MKPWVKLYTDLVRNWDIHEMTWMEKGVWCLLLALAGEVDARDENDKETGAVGPIQQIRWRLNLSEDDARAMIAKYVELGWVDIRDEIVYITKYRVRQERPYSESAEGLRDRQRRFRAAHALPAKRTSEETQAIFYASLEQHLAKYGVVDPSDAQMAAWSALEEYAGDTLFAASMRDASEKSTDGKVRLSYVEAIVKRCKGEGTLPGEWKNGTKETHEPAPPMPTSWYNPLTGQVETQ